MPTYKLAHVRQQGVDLIIIPLSHDFDNQTDDARASMIAELQTRASSAGLAGTVVPVWPSNGRMKFIAPNNWHAYFRNINLAIVQANINRELSW